MAASRSSRSGKGAQSGKTEARPGTSADPAVVGISAKNGQLTVRSSDEDALAAVSSFIMLVNGTTASGRAALTQALIESVDSVSGDDLDESVWGPAPTTDDLAIMRLSSLAVQFDDRKALAANSLSREQTAELLGVSPQAVTQNLEKGELAGFKTGRAWLIPSWQFDPDTQRGFLPGIADLTAAFPAGVVSLSRWVVRDSVDLDGRTPRDALAAGDLEAVLALASSLTAAGW